MSIHASATFRSNPKPYLIVFGIALSWSSSSSGVIPSSSNALTQTFSADAEIDSMRSLSKLDGI